MTRQVELAGPCSHDGFRMDVPDNVVAIALVSEVSPDHVEVSLSLGQGVSADMRLVIADALLSLALDFSEPYAEES